MTTQTSRKSGDERPISTCESSSRTPSGRSVGIWSGGISSYTFSVHQVEKLTGLNFFASLQATEQNELEQTAKELTAQ